MDGWMDGWMGGWMDAWMDGWITYNLITLRNKKNVYYVGPAKNISFYYSCISMVHHC
jgi:hypothetical protein